ncbi:LPS export ABC transporter permease LptF [Aliivibrio finisterrensis]|uniref:Lipopolysaccharide export system permease protein LptF n=1 Tax=Aliivibrio finisterrensis TaxID=511998 RepID=A0A6N6RRT2_9GAMM|nr:LPS export ABC transporter permease LptF [Aliivibrio finisterrensis]KAB2824127.1 LPS export ABC transporter permease LptF [Aliivibrio finisterrensis]
MIIIRYLIKETLKSQFAVFFVLFLIFMSQKFISILADASDGDIPGGLILSLVGLNMPAMGLLMLPLSIFIGILLTFGRLYAESEITVMNATGMGNAILIRAALYLALITGVAAAVNSLWLSPWSQEKTTQLMETVESDAGIDLLQKGQFQRSPDGNAVVFIDDISNKNGKQLENIFLAQPVPHESLRPSVLVAEKGVVKELPDGRQVLDLQDGTRYEGIPTRLDYLESNFKSYELLIGQKDVKEKRRDWDAIPTLDLMKRGELEAKAELQWRISLIICIPLLTMVVVPLSAVNPRQGRFAKLGPAVLLYLAYFLSLSAGKSAIEDGGLAPYVGLWAINAVLLIIGIVLNSMDSVFVRQLKEKMRRKPKHV